jgi:RNA-directed DNA polymerase
VAGPTPGGGGRTRGLPTVLDRLLHQALPQGRPPAWDQTVSEGSDGGRPGRAAPQAIARAHAEREAGYRGVVDRERAPCFARVHQATRMRLGKERGPDRGVVQQIDRSLQAGALTGEGFEAPTEGSPQGAYA